MSGFVWDDVRHALGVADMDATHRDFVALASRLAQADDAAFAALFGQLLDHTRGHFAAEDAKMRATRFPALGEHVGEHQRVLGELRAFNRSVQAGRQRMARAYVRESLPEWFALHLATMDSALAAHLRRQAAA
jgi:hemerythrin-like metal-binding protein